MNLQKLRAMREGQRRIISRQLEKFDEELTELDKRELLDVLSKKAEIIKGLNEKIINNTEVEDIETELVESEEYSIELGLKLGRLQENVGNAKRQTTNESESESVQQQGRLLGENGNSTIQSTENTNTNVNNQNVSNPLHSFPAQTHKLPKLKLPEFDEDITMWQTFWDSYDSAVHSNPTLSDVQKFNYLRSLVHGTAAAAISGFPLTHANYGNAVQLLKQRFGKPDLIRSTLMQSLLDIPKPNDSAQSLRSFHDKMETLVRGLESLGQSQDSYGDLLIPIILEKLPDQIRQNMARERRTDSNLCLADLRYLLDREISILEAGKSSVYRDHNLQTATFFTGSDQRQKSRKNTFDDKHVCQFCGKNHHAVDCNVKNDVKTRLDVVKAKNLCFNCLGKHRDIECPCVNRKIDAGTVNENTILACVSETSNNRR